MKQFALYSFLLFIVIAVLALMVDYANVWLICSSSGNTAYKMKRLYENPVPEEIAIVGSSRACGNFVPSLISPKCFDYGVNGMTMGETMSILEVLSKRQSHAPVIVNLDPWGNFSNSVIADYRLAPQSGKCSLWEHIPGVRFFGSLRKNMTSFIDARDPVTRVIDNGAQLLKNSRTPSEWAAINKKITEPVFVCPTNECLRFVNILKSFSPRKVYVVVGPCSSVWSQRFKGGKQLLRMLKQLNDIPNVEVVNFYGSSDFSDSDFTDPTHLNVSGARKF